MMVGLGKAQAMITQQITPTASPIFKRPKVLNSSAKTPCIASTHLHMRGCWDGSPLHST